MPRRLKVPALVGVFDPIVLRNDAVETEFRVGCDGPVHSGLQRARGRYLNFKIWLVDCKRESHGDTRFDKRNSRIT